MVAICSCKGNASEDKASTDKIRGPITSGAGQAKGVLGQLKVPKLPMTTSPALVANQINGKVEQLRGVLAKQTDAFSQQQFAPQLVGVLLERAHILGTISDYKEASEIAGRVAEAHADRYPKLHTMHARTLAATHDFDAATAALDRAVASGKMKESDIVLSRASIWLAQGQARRVWEALKDRNKKRTTAPMSFMTAVALSDIGAIDGAEDEFRRVLSARSDGSPQPIVKALFHWGRMWERQGKRAKAKALYEVAYERLPIYAPLASHLAALEHESGNTKRAIKILEPLITQSDDPEYRGQLGAYLAPTDATRSQKLIEDARTSYQALLGENGKAFADHAARFYLGAGDNTVRAFELAGLNLQNRQADESFQLFLDAAHATSDTSESTCATAIDALSVSDASSYLLFAASRTLTACGDNAMAKAALDRAAKAKRER